MVTTEKATACYVSHNSVEEEKTMLGSQPKPFPGTRSADPPTMEEASMYKTIRLGDKRKTASGTQEVGLSSAKKTPKNGNSYARAGTVGGDPGAAGV